MTPKYKSFIILLVIILLFILNVTASLILALAAMVFLLFTEPRIIKFFTKPGFLLFAAIALGIPLLISFSLQELQQNSLILLKGILITLWIYLYTQGFTSSNTYKKIKRFLPGELISLINISSGAIAAIQQTTFKEIGKIKEKKSSYYEHVVNFFYTFAKLSESISSKIDKMNSKKVFILTGKIHEGKTTLASNIAKEAIDAGLKVGGILARAEMEKGENIAYYVEDLKTHQREKLITKEPVTEYYDRFWSYYFLKDGMKLSLKCLSPRYLRDRDIVIIDEIGAMELEDRGYSKQLSKILNSDISIVILIIREQFIDAVSRKFSLAPQQIIRIGDSPTSAIKSIQSCLHFSLT